MKKRGESMTIESRSRQYGVVFDHWQIREFLGSGSGGKSAVFRLSRVDSTWGTSALKVINLIEEKGNINTISEYRREEYEQAKAACKKSAEQEVRLMDEMRGNTNIVDYLDHKFVDWSDENGFGCDMLIRMELLEDLRGKLRDGVRYSEKEVLKIGRDICTALVLCHGKNILHRDIKPENIFINPDGNFKLGDFGVSRILSSAPTAVASTGIGTPEYAAPEQFSGCHDKRVDIYSLGLVLYELSNGNRLPFASTGYTRPVDVERRQKGEPLPPPCNASHALAGIILKACAFRKEDRYPSANALLDALDDFSGISAKAGNTPQKTAPAPGGNATQRASADDIRRYDRYAIYPAGDSVYDRAEDYFPASEKTSSQPNRAANGTLHNGKAPNARRKRRAAIICWAGLICVALALCWNAIFNNTGKPDDNSSPNTQWQATEPSTEKAVEPSAEKAPEPSAEPAPTYRAAEHTDPLTMSEYAGNVSDLSLLTFSDASATSELDDPTYGKFPASNACDGKTLTSWQEGEIGCGIGESITLSLPEDTEVSAIFLYLGNMESEYAYYANSRPSELLFSFSDGISCTYHFEDSFRCYRLALSRPVKTDYIQITILDAYEADWKDTAISEIIAYSRGHEHIWIDASVMEPKTCSLCGATEGYSLGHSLTLCEISECSPDANIGLWQDIFGNEYNNAVRFWVANRPGWTNTESVAFKTDGKYDLLELTIVSAKESGQSASFNVSVYADGQLIYISDQIDNHTSPVSAYVSITSVEELKVICTTDDEASAYCIVNAVIKCAGNVGHP